MIAAKFGIRKNDSVSEESSGHYCGQLLRAATGGVASGGFLGSLNPVWVQVPFFVLNFDIRRIRERESLQDAPHNSIFGNLSS